jgi:serine/threonine protein kinase
MSFSFSTQLDRRLNTEDVNHFSSPSPKEGAVGTLQSREVRVIKDPSSLFPQAAASNLLHNEQQLKDESWPLKKRMAFDRKHLQKEEDGRSSSGDPMLSHEGHARKERASAVNVLHQDPQPTTSDETLGEDPHCKNAFLTASAPNVQQEDHDSSPPNSGIMHPLPSEFVIGTSRITPINVLGFGSYGYVHEALLNSSSAHEPLRVAIKVNKLFEDQDEHREYVETLSEEARILSKLQKADEAGQKAIARFIAAGYVSAGCFCLVQSLYERDISCLLDHHQRSQRLSLKDISKIAFQLLDALRFLKHPSINIIHCDLKPQNIFLENVRDYRVRIGDFGSAKEGPQDNLEGEYLITRWYRPPEVVFRMPFHFAADIWSFGCIMYEMFTLRPFFPATDESHLIKMMYEFLGVAPESFVTKIDGHSSFFESALDYPGYFHLRTYTPGPRENRREVSNQRLDFDSSKVVDCFDTERNYLSFKNFLQRTLSWDDSARFTPERLLAHPFISQLECSGTLPAAAGEAAAD